MRTNNIALVTSSFHRQCEPEPPEKRKEEVAQWNGRNINGRRQQEQSAKGINAHLHDLWLLLEVRMKMSIALKISTDLNDWRVNTEDTKLGH